MSLQGVFRARASSWSLLAVRTARAVWIFLVEFMKFEYMSIRFPPWSTDFQLEFILQCMRLPWVSVWLTLVLHCPYRFCPVLNFYFISFHWTSIPLPLQCWSFYCQYIKLRWFCSIMNFLVMNLWVFNTHWRFISGLNLWALWVCMEWFCVIYGMVL